MGAQMTALGMSGTNLPRSAAPSAPRAGGCAPGCGRVPIPGPRRSRPPSYSGVRYLGT